MLTAVRVEQLIARVPPEVNCALFLVGFYLGVSYLLAHLSWYGIPPGTPGWPSESHRMLLKMSIFLGLIVAVTLVAPGSAHRRLFSACAFPLLALLAMLVDSACVPLITRAGHSLFEALIQGLTMGILITAVVAFPVALLFRGSCLPVALLIALPALAKEEAFSGASQWHWATFLCEAAVIAASTYICHRRLPVGRPK